MKYSDLDGLLRTVLPDATFHLSATEKLSEYILWMETGSRSEFGDNCRSAKVLMASVFIYTQEDSDELIRRVCEVLDNAGCVAYADPIPAYDDEQLTMGWIVECEFV